jgi:DNA-binding LacI/PurR family transcriptional regulator
MTYRDLAHAGEWLAAMPSVDACVVRLQGDVLPAGILATLRARCRAVVIEGVPVEHVDVDSVATDWLLAIETAIRHLQSRGHRKIALALNAADTRFAREGARLFRSLMRTAGDDEPVVAYRSATGYDLAGATAVIAWSIAVAQQMPPGTPMVMMENPDIGAELPGVTIVGRTSARIATAVVERIDFRLNNPDAAFAPVYDKPKLVVP